MEDCIHVVLSGALLDGPSPRGEDELAVGVDVVEEDQVLQAGGVGHHVLNLETLILSDFYEIRVEIIPQSLMRRWVP